MSKKRKIYTATFASHTFRDTIFTQGRPIGTRESAVVSYRYNVNSIEQKIENGELLSFVNGLDLVFSLGWYFFQLSRRLLA